MIKEKIYYFLEMKTDQENILARGAANWKFYTQQDGYLKGDQRICLNNMWRNKPFINSGFDL